LHLFHGSIAVAPLKRGHQADLLSREILFHGSIAVAPLKLVSDHRVIATQ